MKTLSLFLLTLASVNAVQVPPPVAPVQTTSPQPSLRAIPDDNLAYPVFVVAGNSTGSGFYMTKEKETFFITAKHVLFDPASNLLRSPNVTLISYSKDLTDSTKNIVNVNMALLQTSNDLRAHKAQDVVAVKVFNMITGSTISPVVGVAITSASKTGFLTVDFKIVKTFDQVLTGNDVMVFGYPTSLGLQQFPQLDPLRPLLRKGIVAGTNPAARTLVLDCPVYFGNSGGPVIEIDRQAFGTSLSIIGVVDQYVPFVQQAGSQTLSMQLQANSGYSLAVPMDYVLELIK
jgi:S1-C subfamily serine protease